MDASGTLVTNVKSRFLEATAAIGSISCSGIPNEPKSWAKHFAATESA